MINKLNIVVLYYNLWSHPLRDTIKSHLYSFKKYSSHNVIYINTAFGVPKRILRFMPIDAVIFHTILLSKRWIPTLFNKIIQKCSYFNKLKCVKIAIPQDEFIYTDILNEVINDFNINYILTCAEKGEWRKIYNRVDRNKTKFMTVLTGYISDDTIQSIERLKSKKKYVRSIDIGYRAWKSIYSLGSHAQYKTGIADIFQKKSKKYGFNTDISMGNKDVLLGDKWFKFLLRCKFTIGVEGGASVLDRDGSIKDKIEQYIKVHPKASFEEVKDVLLKKIDGNLNLKCISPRHFEACITKTCQLLIEGNYNNILIPWKHYLPVKKDYSNIDELYKIMKNESAVNQIIKNAYRDIVESELWTYETFVKKIEELTLNNINQNEKETNNRNFFIIHYLKIRENINLLIIIAIAGMKKLLLRFIPESNVTNFITKFTKIK